MKKIFIVLMIILAGLRSGAQQREISSVKPSEEYLKKCKSQRNTGLLLLGSGAACFGFGFYALEHAGEKNGYGALFILGGMGVAATSLPFFIGSAISKHKANISMKREVYMITPGQRSNLSYNSIGLRLSL